jgi:flagellar basal body-associated protein FliL
MDPEEQENIAGEEQEGHLIEEHLEGKSNRRRKKIKIRQRVRIKRKSDPKKRVKKMLETIAWILIIAAFVVTLVVLVMQLDFNSKNKKKRSELSTSPPVTLSLPNVHSQLS